ncbi:retrotransposable element ORF2 protein [Nymphaea thermarum]|nr:retrotransposable element ORF2 protein [Nymphaea thermarum]
MRRGLRQGDPPSLYLFNFVMEVIFRGYSYTATNGCIKVPWMPMVGRSFFFLAFADDVILFSKADTQSLSFIKAFLAHIEDYSGLSINSSKSVVIPFNFDHAQARRVSSFLRWDLQQLPIRYLGLPLFAGDMSLEHCRDLLQKVDKRLPAWRISLLSYAGRLCLLKHVLWQATSLNATLSLGKSCVNLSKKGELVYLAALIDARVC